MKRRSERDQRYFHAQRGHRHGVHAHSVGSTQGSSLAIDPHAAAKALGLEISDALDPVKAPGKVKRFTAEEIAKLNAKLRTAP